MTTSEINVAVSVAKLCAQTAMLLPLEQAVELLNQQTHEETIMPILDPTQFRNNMPAIEQNRKFLKAFVAYRRALEELSGTAGADHA